MVHGVLNVVVTGALEDNVGLSEVLGLGLVSGGVGSEVVSEVVRGVA